MRMPHAHVYCLNFKPYSCSAHKKQSIVQVTGLVNARTHTLHHASFEASVEFFFGIISPLIFSNIYKAFLNDSLPPQLECWIKTEGLCCSIPAPHSSVRLNRGPNISALALQA